MLQRKTFHLVLLGVIFVGLWLPSRSSANVGYNDPWALQIDSTTKACEVHHQGKPVKPGHELHQYSWYNEYVTPAGRCYLAPGATWSRSGYADTYLDACCSLLGYETVRFSFEPFSTRTEERDIWCGALQNWTGSGCQFPVKKQLTITERCNYVAEKDLLLNHASKQCGLSFTAKDVTIEYRAADGTGFYSLEHRPLSTGECPPVTVEGAEAYQPKDFMGFYENGKACDQRKGNQCCTELGYTRSKFSARDLLYYWKFVGVVLAGGILVLIVALTIRKRRRVIPPPFK